MVVYKSTVSYWHAGYSIPGTFFELSLATRSYVIMSVRFRPQDLDTQTENNREKYREGNKFVIPYFFQTGYTEDLKEDISRALKDLGDNTCIDFRAVSQTSKGKFINLTSVIINPISDFEHKIKIIAGSGCYSYVGFQGIREQTISLREVGCLSRGTVQHEFMHALGFYHEQARPDAKEHVKIQE